MTHISVSRRIRSRISLKWATAEGGGIGTVRSLHLRISRAVPPIPRTSTAKGITQPTILKPSAGGAASEVGPYFSHKGGKDRLVAVAPVDAGHQFLAHPIGVWAADVVALQQELVAAAAAHDLVAQLVEARAGICGGSRQNHGGQQ